MIIVFLCHPAQIVCAVIQGITVNVINGIADRRVRVRAKSLCDQTTNKKMLRNTEGWLFLFAYAFGLELVPSI